MSAPPRAAFALVLGLFVVLMGATWFRHTDVGDAQLYEVIARQMLRSGDWLTLEYLGQPFYDHLPFGLWPIAAAQALSPRAVIPLHALFSVLTVSLVGVAANRLKGAWAALAAMFVLATSQFYFFQTSYPTLDPLLLLLTTTSVAPVIAGEGNPRSFLMAWLFAALAVAVKGPFGLLPLGGVLGARVLVDRSWRHLGWGALAFILAAAPVAVFLALRPDWAEGYGVGQLLASATGTRTDGGSGSSLAVRFIADRFWPWFPLLFVAAGCALRELACRRAAVACALVLFGLSVPHRKIWHHTLVVYPLLAIWIGVAIGPWLGARLPKRATSGGLAAMMLLALLAVFAGVDRLLMARPCVLATDFAEELELVRPGDRVAVVSERPEWDMLSALAFERDVKPRRVVSWEEATTESIAVATEAAWAAAPPQWHVRVQARGWVLATRSR
jgi:4-amino-4-deoxy-L-arabinose transferase-like glycosyltransferase